MLAFPPYWISRPTDLFDSLQYAPFWDPPSLGMFPETWGGRVIFGTELLCVEIVVLAAIAVCGLILMMDAPRYPRNLFHQ